MARGGTKFPLIVYQHMLNRWWTPMIAIGLGMFALAYSEYIEPIAKFLPWRWQLLMLIMRWLSAVLFWMVLFKIDKWVAVTSIP